MEPPATSSPLSAFRNLASARQVAKLTWRRSSTIRDHRAVSQITAPSRQRLSIGMACAGAPIIEVLRDTDQLDRLCLTLARAVVCGVAQRLFSSCLRRLLLLLLSFMASVGTAILTEAVSRQTRAAGSGGPSLRRRIIKLVQCSASYLWLSSPGLYPWGWPKVIA